MVNKVYITFSMVVAILMIFTIIYNVQINSEVSVVNEEIKINNLPEEFEGFKILVLTDLHNKSFGKEQEDLLKVVNSLDYDMIAICGDMMNRQEEDYSAFLDLLEGIKNKDEIYYTPGNHGPFVYEGDVGFNSIIKGNEGKQNGYSLDGNKALTEAGEFLKQYGVKFLDEVHEIKRGNSSLWISELWYKDELDKLTNNKINEDDINIAITHYPMSKGVYEGSFGKRLSQYDLVLAGHYHGGQWQIPAIGALFIPDLNESGFLPSQERVSGLTTWGGINQYVSKGLGAGGPIELLRFRLFNRPEMNLITLVKSN